MYPPRNCLNFASTVPRDAYPIEGACCSDSVSAALSLAVKSIDTDLDAAFLQYGVILLTR